MNFSNTKVLRKVLSLILAGVMMLSLFTGCMKKAEETEPSDTQPNINLVDDTTPTETTPATTPATTEPEITENTARVTSQLSIRNTPSKDGGVIGTLDAGDLVEILRTSTVAGVLWGYIAEPLPAGGWICMDYVTMLNPGNEEDLNTSTPGQTTDPADTTQSFKGVITANDLNIRNEPSTTGTIVGQYDKGDVVTILETKDGWGRTSQGWISLDYVNSATGNTNTNTNTNTNNNTTNTNNNTNTNTNKDNTGNGSTTVVAKGIVIAKELNVRASATTDSDRVKGLTYGTRVEIYGRLGSHFRRLDLPELCV